MDNFFGIGFAELVMIVVVALVVLGPERLPEAIRTLAKLLRQVRSLYNELISQFDAEVKVLDDLNPQKLLNELVGPLDDAPAQITKSKSQKPGVKQVIATAKRADSVPPQPVTPSRVTAAEHSASAFVEIPDKSPHPTLTP